MEKIKINDESSPNYSHIFAVYSELLKIAKSLHKLDENSCNYGLTPRQEAQKNKLEARADELAQSLGLKAYHQGDPRGGTLYLIDETMNDTNYNNGIYIC